MEGEIVRILLDLMEKTPTGYEFIERYQVEINQGDGTPVGGDMVPTRIPTKPREGGDSERWRRRR